MPSKSDFVEVMAKHLPPSASELHLLDIGGTLGADLRQRRPDIRVEVASLDPQHWHYSIDSFDAVVAYDILLKSDLLSSILTVMRAGGRFIIVNPLGTVDEAIVKTLEKNGYVRILVEAALDGEGVLIRGEKSHSTTNTVERIQKVAQGDADSLELEAYRGRFIHLLIVQSPNKPVWRLEPNEKIDWRAAAIEKNDETTLLAFSSLPKAVGFMQSAVVEGYIRDVNKVGKFSKETVTNWHQALMLNPTLGSVQKFTVRWQEVDPNSAETPDE